MTKALPHPVLYVKGFHLLSSSKLSLYLIQASGQFYKGGGQSYLPQLTVLPERGTEVELMP